MYKMMKLPYAYDALEPVIIEEIVDLHYNKHYKSYFDNLIEVLNKVDFDYSYPLEELPKRIGEFPLNDRGIILYNAGGVLNHDLYWNSTNGVNSLPTGKLLKKINERFGNISKFIQAFIDKADYLAGSGYTVLAANLSGELQIINTVNQDTLLAYNLIPLFNIDLWEHAYYLQYKNDRKGYIRNFWNKANFDYASKKYEEIFG